MSWSVSSKALSVFSSVQSLSRIWFFATPWTAAHQASLSTLPELAQTHVHHHLVIPSNHFIFCCPPFLLPLIFPSTWVCSNESVLRIRWPKYWTSQQNKVLVTQSCPTLCDPMDYNLPTVHGILQVRILELPFPPPGDLPDSGIEPMFPALQQILYCLSHHESLQQSKEKTNAAKDMGRVLLRAFSLQTSWTMQWMTPSPPRHCTGAGKEPHTRCLPLMQNPEFSQVLRPWIWLLRSCQTHFSGNLVAGLCKLWLLALFTSYRILLIHFLQHAKANGLY